MGTQAVVSVVRNGQTIVKCVAGCNGRNAFSLANEIASGRLETVESIHAAATNTRYGCFLCLVTKDKDRMLGYKVEALAGSLYASKFSDPRFNPRWKRGTAPHVLLVDADTWVVTDVSSVE